MAIDPTTGRQHGFDPTTGKYWSDPDPHLCADYELCKHCGQCFACCGCY